MQQTKDIPHDIDRILEEFRITLHQENVGGVGDTKGGSYHVSWPVRSKAKPDCERIATPGSEGPTIAVQLLPRHR